MSQPTKAQIDAVLKFLPALQSGKPLKSKLRRGKGIQMPWHEMHPKVRALIHALYENKLLPCDFGKRQINLRKFTTNPNRLRSANLKTLRYMLFYCWSCDRIIDGYFARMVENGRIRAILERLAEIRKSMRS